MNREQINNLINTCQQEIRRLQEENQELKADYGTKAQVERDLLMEENQKYKEVTDKAINSIDILQEIIYQQPTNNSADDLWLLDKLDGIKNILKEVE